MPNITLFFGIILILLGCGTFICVGPTMTHATAMIPAAFGLLLAICAYIARRERWRKHAMHVAVLIGLVGVIVPAVLAAKKVPELVREGKVVELKDGVATDRTTSVVEQLAMAVISLVFVVLCIKSFIDARRARRANAAAKVPPSTV